MSVNVLGTNLLQQLPKLSAKTLTLLRGAKNLLAYSAGSDSSALFHALYALEIDFDIATVNYKTRLQSDDEVAYAMALAKKFDKQCFSLTCKLEKNNFEHYARVKRYEFFKDIIFSNNYQNLLTAHHLNDKFEWFLMQLSKGAGLVELLGFEEIQKMPDYMLIRPLINTSKQEIENFLHVNDIKYFFDGSNEEEKYKRNKIRAQYANSFLQEYKEGVLKSFEYLSEDAKRFSHTKINNIQELYTFQKDEDELINIRTIDKILKNSMGYLLSKAQRDEIQRTKECVIASTIAICYGHKEIFIAPFCEQVMDKKFKEACRKNQIPSKIRPYMYKTKIDPKEFR